MKDNIKECWKNDLWLKIMTFVAIGLIVASFVLPPTGIIDPSVFAGTGELFAFGAIWEFNRAMDKNIAMKIKIKETELEILQRKQQGMAIEDETKILEDE